MNPENRARRAGEPGLGIAASVGDMLAATEPPQPRIVLLASQLGVGGAERHLVALANHLAARFDIVLAYLKRDEALLGLVDLAYLRAAECVDVRGGIDRAGIRRLAGLFERHRPEVVLCANHYAMAYAMLANVLAPRRARVVEIFHTTILDSWRSRLQMALVYQPLSLFASALVYVCESQRRYWLRRGLVAKRVRVIHNGVDTARFDSAPYEATVEEVRRGHGFVATDMVVGICAVLRPEKAHVDLLHAVSRARNRGRVWKVLIIGDGPRRSSIERTIDELGLRGSVQITGLLADVRPQLAACDVIALVSVAVETFSIAALESMSMGKPMIMSDIGGAREQVVHGETGWLFPPGDVEALARYLVDAPDRKGLAVMGRAARLRTRQLYSLNTMLHAYADLIEELAKRS